MNTYTIYYGWLTADSRGEPNDAARRIAAARLPLLIAHLWTAAPQRHRNLSPQVLALMHEAGTSVFAYVATSWGRASVGHVKRQVLEYINAGVDGIFFDEADALLHSNHHPYYDVLAQLVWRRGKSVILNPGVAQCGEAIMDLADAIMVEHQWRNFARASPWLRNHSQARFMGVSSNEENAMGYSVDAERALEDTREAWQSGIGWHTSTERYTALPAWFDAYVEAVKA